MTNEHQNIQVAAHEFNEELTIILNTAEIAARLLGLGHPANDAIVELRRSVDRCAELTRRLRALAC